MNEYRVEERDRDDRLMWRSVNGSRAEAMVAFNKLASDPDFAPHGGRRLVVLGPDRTRIGGAR